VCRLSYPDRDDDFVGRQPASNQRILFLVSSMQGGGAERVAALLCNNWAARGHRVTLMPTFSGRGECIYPLDQRVRLDYLADRLGTTRQSGWNKMRRLWALRRIIHLDRPDVVVSFLPHVNVAAILAALGSEVPVIVSERTYPPMLPLSRTMERLRRWSYPRAAAVVMQTEQGRKWLEAMTPDARAYIIPNPVVYPLPVGVPQLAPDTVVAEGREILLAVGRLGEEKRFDRVVDAFARLADRYPSWDLVILGEGAQREDLEARREQLGVGARIHLPGRVGNLSDWYRRASLYVMSSRFEGFPNTLLEAMAHGLPAVSVDCETGPRDIIRQGIDGLLVPPDDGAEGLARALEALIADPDRREQMAAAAVEVRERFSMDHIAAQWDRILGLE
jgi:GalNAc-alpha-(1->4)-GalNAc-alpha-(1->3)-diNAcBac-PP-undecaprenol alpha-1,4-N-acetyl-D-galactosaminyltransferase